MDVEADNLRHQREERERQQKRREKRANKSEAQLQKEARRKEYAQRIIAEKNKNLASAKSRSPKPPPPSEDKDLSKFQALFKKRADGFIIDLNFRNAAPRPPVGPCFVGLGLDGELNDNWTRYKPNNAVEANYSWQLHAESDLGVPLAPSAMDLEGCYVDPTKQSKKSKGDGYNELFDNDEEAEKRPPPLHPDDEAIINWKGYKGDSAADELQRRRDIARAEARLQGMDRGKMLPTGPQQQIKVVKRTKDFQSRVLNEQNPFFMKKTTYLANDPTQSVHAFKSLAQTKAEAAAEIEQKLVASKISGTEVINKSFEIANKVGVKRMHPKKKNVQAVYEIPLLPDDLTWGYTYTHVVLDKLPKADTNRKISTRKLESSYIADVKKGELNLRMECNLLVTDDDVTDDEQPVYNPVQKYELDVIPLKEENAPHSNFLFVLDEESMMAKYHPVSSRVQLSTGRPAHQNVGSRKILKRKLQEEEVISMEKALAEVDADMAKKYTATEPKRQNPFAASGDGDSSDESDADF